MEGWIRVDEERPEENVVVETKIDDKRGVRKIAKLLRDGAMWWLPDRDVYMHYRPTHWRKVRA